MSYLLSIVVPTKDRYKYLRTTLLNLCKLDSRTVEIIVQDNTFDNSEFLEFLADIKQDNIKYYHSCEKLSQTENSDCALSHATGEYCCYIGDDDTVMPQIIELTKYLEENAYEACTCEEACFYWPDVVFEKKRSRLKFNTKEYHLSVKRTRDVFEYVLSYGMQDINLLPRVYHGIVSMKVLNQIYSIAGTYFPGPSPDMANATACTLLIQKHLHTEMPVLFSGVGYTSGAGMGERGEHKGELKAGKQMPKDAEEKWSERIPKLWLGYTVWAESAEKAMIAMKKTEYLAKINISAMDAKIFLRYKEYREYIKERNRTPKNTIKLYYECIRFGFKYLYAELRLSIRVKRGLVKKIEDLMSFEDAYKIVLNSNEKIKGLI